MRNSLSRKQLCVGENGQKALYIYISLHFKSDIHIDKENSTSFIYRAEPTV